MYFNFSIATTLKKIQRKMAKMTGDKLKWNIKSMFEKKVFDQPQKGRKETGQHKASGTNRKQMARWWT